MSRSPTPRSPRRSESRRDDHPPGPTAAVRRPGGSRRTDRACPTRSSSTVQRWLAESSEVKVDPAAERLAGVLKDPRGLQFTVGFVDGVIRPEDAEVAARNFAVLAKDVPRFLPWHLRMATRLGAVAGKRRPGTGHPDRPPGAARDGRPPDRRRPRRPTGQGDREDPRTTASGSTSTCSARPSSARRRPLAGSKGTHDLLDRDDVDYVSIKVSSTRRAALDLGTRRSRRARASASLTPLFEHAAKSSPKKFINLDMEEYRDLDLTIEVFTALLDRPAVPRPRGRHRAAGLPSRRRWRDDPAAGLGAAARGAAAARRSRCASSRAPTCRWSASTPSLHDWPLATWGSKQDSDTNYKRVLDYALHPERVRNVRHRRRRAQPVRHRLRLAARRRTAACRDGVEFEMLLGMAQGQAQVVKREVGTAAALHAGRAPARVRRRDRLPDPPARRGREPGQLHVGRVRAARPPRALRARARPLPGVAPRARPHRARSPIGCRTAADPFPTTSCTGFDNVPDTDTSLPANTTWSRGDPRSGRDHHGR